MDDVIDRKPNGLPPCYRTMTPPALLTVLESAELNGFDIVAANCRTELRKRGYRV